MVVLTGKNEIEWCVERGIEACAGHRLVDRGVMRQLAQIVEQRRQSTISAAIAER